MVIGVIIISLLMFFIVKYALRKEADLTYPSTIIVQNSTKHTELDKITKTIVHHVLGYDTMNIGIAYMPKRFEKIGNKNVRAYIQKNIFQEHAYIILISKKFRISEYKLVMSHEMAHLDQYERDDLIQIELGLEEVIYKGDTINFHEVPYDERPHEKDAYQQEDHIYKQLDKILYK